MPASLEGLADVEAEPLYAAPPSVQVPEGWQLVPKKTTPEMRTAGANATADFTRFEVDKVYTAMLSAAPLPVQGEGGEGATETVELHRLVRHAYEEGFTEGMKEETSRRGGKPWQDSYSRAALARLPSPPAEEGKNG